MYLYEEERDKRRNLIIREKKRKEKEDEWAWNNRFLCIWVCWSWSNWQIRQGNYTIIPSFFLLIRACIRSQFCHFSCCCSTMKSSAKELPRQCMNISDKLPIPYLSQFSVFLLLLLLLLMMFGLFWLITLLAPPLLIQSRGSSLFLIFNFFCVCRNGHLIFYLFIYFGLIQI